MFLQPINYCAPVLHYKYKTNCFTERQVKGVTKLSRKPKAEADVFACINMSGVIRKNQRYSLRISFKTKTKGDSIEFCILDKTMTKIQPVLKYELSEDEKETWIVAETEFVVDADNYVYFGFRGGQLYGMGNYIMIDNIVIDEIYSSSGLRLVIDRAVGSVNKNINTWADKAKFLHWSNARIGDETTLDAKKRFFRSLKNENEQLLAMQNATSILLKEFGRICAKYDIPYWLDFGTLIGAVRHGGFIPWDDDIDVGMMRKDIDKLEEVMKTEESFVQLSKYFCIDRDTCNIVRIIFKDDSIKIFVDIFIYDFCDTDDMNATWKEVMDRRVRFSKGMRIYRDVKDIPTNNHWENRRIDNPEHIRLIEQTRDQYNEEVNIKRDSGNVIVWGIDNVSIFANKPGGIVPYDRIFPLKKLTFDGVEYCVPNGYDDQLRDRYGDIYSLPGDMYSHAHVSRTDEMMNKCKEAIEKYK